MFVLNVFHHVKVHLFNLLYNIRFEKSISSIIFKTQSQSLEYTVSLFVSTKLLTVQETCSPYLFHCYLFSHLLHNEVQLIMTQGPLWHQKENALFHGFTFTSELTDTTAMFGGICYISQIL